jgi:hypothetical protein
MMTMLVIPLIFLLPLLKLPLLLLLLHDDVDVTHQWDRVPAGFDVDFVIGNPGIDFLNLHLGIDLNYHPGIELN